MRYRIATVFLTALAILIPFNPTSATADQPSIEVSRHGVVRDNSMPPCRSEDDPDGPCTWNIDNDDIGLQFWVGSNGRRHYVWDESPLKGHPQRMWVHPWLANAMRHTDAPRATTRNWYKCWTSANVTRTKVRCPDGLRVIADRDGIHIHTP